MISVDTVYKTVLYILNKEQRGYLTPEEFNKIAIELGDYRWIFRNKTIEMKMKWLFIASEDLEDTAVTAILAAIFENKEQLKKARSKLKRGPQLK